MPIFPRGETGIFSLLVILPPLKIEVNVFIKLLVLFTIVPVIELVVLLKVGGLLGTAPTIALILLTGVAGAYLARTQGFELLRGIQSELAQGRLPADQMLDGVMVLVGGVLLLTPGFCTDLLGFLFLVPFTRAGIKRWVKFWLQHNIDRGNITIHRL